MNLTERFIKGFFDLSLADQRTCLGAVFWFFAPRIQLQAVAHVESLAKQAQKTSVPVSEGKE
ncbi:MAG: hypothetical protein IPP19_03370 [Verrucomicrobia bacterium]|nr:hypothetical protein [Verrucomicrobiota bacterium]